ncbi:hypothetical protein JOC24_004136 [Streptomyces sp. HB132]|nr:hypothetical protein [Streptomyces sp. HB132]
MTYRLINRRYNYEPVEGRFPSVVQGR